MCFFLIKSLSKCFKSLIEDLVFILYLNHRSPPKLPFHYQFLLYSPLHFHSLSLNLCPKTLSPRCHNYLGSQNPYIVNNCSHLKSYHNSTIYPPPLHISLHTSPSYLPFPISYSQKTTFPLPYTSRGFDIKHHGR